MSYWWRYESADGSLRDRPDPERFPSQADAESWIGESWADLLGEGVDQVSLLEADRLVYGPMSLHPGP